MAEQSDSKPPCATEVAAIILAGGKGSRLAHLDIDIPKALIPLGGKSLLQHAVEWVNPHVSSIWVATGHHITAIRNNIDEKSIILVEDPDVGTGKALLEASKHLNSEHIIICNADTINDLNISMALNEHLARGKGSTICLTRQESAQNANAFRVSPGGQILRSLEDLQPKGKKGALCAWQGASTGVIIVPAAALKDSRLANTLSLEQEIVPHLIDSGGLYAFDNGPRLCLDVGTPERLRFMQPIRIDATWQGRVQSFVQEAAGYWSLYRVLLRGGYAGGEEKWKAIGDSDGDFQIDP